jgi:hypothetical protein
MPSCGTIGCYAGWTAILHGFRPSPSQIFHQIFFLEPRVALDVLTGCANPSDPLRDALSSAFHDTAIVERIQSGKTAGRVLKLRPGTRRYARAVVKRFQAIMDQYETRLRATTVITTGAPF